MELRMSLQKFEVIGLGGRWVSQPKYYDFLILTNFNIICPFDIMIQIKMVWTFEFEIYEF